MSGKRSKWRGSSVVWAAVAAMLLMFPSMARADAGIPMLPVAYPVVLLFLVPVIAIEVLYLRLRLGTMWLNTGISTAAANLITMVLGYPLMWLLWVFIQLQCPLLISKTPSPLIITVFTAAWPTPSDGDRWALLVAFFVLLIPSYFLSAFIESILLSRFHWLRTNVSSVRAVWEANIASYCFLTLFGCLFLWQWEKKFF